MDPNTITIEGTAEERKQIPLYRDVLFSPCLGGSSQTKLQR
jgi:hypothetical protein